MIQRFVARIGTVGVILILVATVLLTGIAGGALEHARLAAHQQQEGQQGDQTGGQGESQQGQTGADGESQQGEQGKTGAQQEDQSGTQGQSQEGETGSSAREQAGSNSQTQ